MNQPLGVSLVIRVIRDQSSNIIRWIEVERSGTIPPLKSGNTYNMGKYQKTSKTQQKWELHKKCRTQFIVQRGYIVVDNRLIKKYLNFGIQWHLAERAASIVSF